MNKILVPYDFSKVATHALNFATKLARKAEACQVTLINVIEQPSSETIKTMGVSHYDPMENVYIKQLIESVKRRMEDIMADEAYKDVDLQYKIVLGHPFKEITAEISTQNIELVVMGTSGASGAEEFLVGSNAERMVRFSKCPVITINAPMDPSDVQDIVLASNFQDVPLHFVENLKKLQQIFDAELKLVRVNTPASFYTTRHDHKLMEDFISKYDLTNCTYDTYNYSNEEDGILAYAEDVDADMIALGTNQLKGVGHFLRGSIAEDVVNHAKVPVWTFGLD